MKTIISLIVILFSISSFAQSFECLDADGVVIKVNGHSDYLCDREIPVKVQQHHQRPDQSECLDAKGNVITVNGHTDWQCDVEMTEKVFRDYKKPESKTTHQSFSYECIDAKTLKTIKVNGHSDWQCL